MKSRTRGFTLVEIMVVITILSLLASAIVFSGSTARESAKGTIGEQDVQQILLAMQLYLGTKGELPPDTTWETAVDELYPDYLTKRIVEDAWGVPFEYDNNYDTGAIGRGSSICSNGPNGTDETNGSDLAVYQAGGDDVCKFIFDED